MPSRGASPSALPDIVVGADGARVAFLRSSGPEDPVNGLWVFDVDSSAERRVVDPAALGADDADLPPEEQARRERARESGGGIVAFDADRDLTTACFALGGQIDVLTSSPARPNSSPPCREASTLAWHPTGRRLRMLPTTAFG